MKSIKMMSKAEFVISDEEVQKLTALIASGKTGLVGLKSGDIINLNSVESISEAETESYFMGNRMNKDETKVFVQGEWKMFAGEKSEIEHRLRAKNGIVDIDAQILLEESEEKQNRLSKDRQEIGDYYTDENGEKMYN